MSNAAAIVHALTEGDEEDFKDVTSPGPHFTYRLLRGRMLPEDPEEWLAQMLWDDSPYGVVAKGQDRAEVEANAQEAVRLFNEQIHEGLDDEDDMKDVTMPSGFQALVKHSPRDNTYSTLFYYNGKFQGSSSGAETNEIAIARAEKWINEFNRVLGRRPFIPADNVDVWSWYYGFGTTKSPKIEEGLDDEDDFKDLASEPWTLRVFFHDGLWIAQLLSQGLVYGTVARHVDEETCRQQGEQILADFNREENYVHSFLSIGKRVRNKQNRELGTITNIGDAGERWVHWDDDGGDPDSQARHLTQELELVESLDDEDDFKDITLDGFNKGTKVRVLTGTYAGEIGTVEGPFHWGNGEIGWWVHLDGSDDTSSAITYQTNSLEVLKESMEEYEADMLSPSYSFNENYRQVGNQVFTAVIHNGHTIGELYHHILTGKPPNWHIGFVARTGSRVAIPVGSKEEGARRLLDDFTLENKIVEAMEDDDLSLEGDFRYELLSTNPDRPVFDIFSGEKWLGRVSKVRVAGRIEVVDGKWQQGMVDEWVPMWTPAKFRHAQPKAFKSAKDAAIWFRDHWIDAANVTEAIIAEMIDDDPDEGWEKDLVHDPVMIAQNLLEQAGFAVTRCEREGDSIILTFDWPVPTATAKLSGWRRATELLEPIIGKIKIGDFKVEVLLREPNGHAQDKVAHALIRKRLEDDPTLWRVQNSNNRPAAHQDFWTVYFHDQPMGRFYAEHEGAERVRREMLELHRIVPFNTVGWGDEPGDAWGEGKAVAWWRAHRNRLPPDLKVGEHFLDKSLLKQL